MKLKLKMMLAAVAVGMAFMASARTMTMTENRVGGILTSFDFEFSDVGAGTTNDLWMVYGASDGGESSYSGWDSIRHVAVVPGDVTSIAGIQLPSGWREGVTHLRFFLSAAGIVPCADRLEYVQATQADGSHQYIKTSFVPSSDSAVEMTFAFNGDYSNQNLFCARGSANYASTFSLFLLSGNGWRWDYNANNRTQSKAPDTNVHTFRADLNGINFIAGDPFRPNFPGTTVPAASYIFKADGPLWIFAAHNSGNYTKDYDGRFKLYAFKAWSNHAAFDAYTNGVTVSNFALDIVPCSRNGVACFFDRASGTFLTNSGTGSFTASETVLAPATDVPDEATRLVVADSIINAVWTGEGADTAVSTSANWLDGKSEYAAGLSSATFATGGAEAGVDAAMSLAGITLATPSSVPEFTFAQLGGGSMSVGDSGIVVSNHEDAVARSFAFNIPVAFATASIDVTNAEDSITFNDALSGASDIAVVTKTGAGSLYLNGTTSVPGGLTICDGACYPGDGSNAVGVAGSKLVVNQLTGGYVQMSNALHTAAAMVLTGPGNTPNNSAAAVRLAENTTNEISGPVQMYDTGFCVPTNSVLSLTGGLALTGGIFWLNDGGIYSISGAPVTSTGGSGVYIQSSGGTLRLSVANNSFGRYFSIYKGFAPSEMGQVICTVPWALNYSDTWFVLGRKEGLSSAVIDIGGCDQGVVRIATHESVKPVATRACRVTSPTSAVLYERTDETRTSYIEYHGAAGYRLVGSGTITLGWDVSPTTGSLGVTNGTLIVGENVSWPNVSEVVVAGSGTFRLTGANQLNPKMTLSLSDDGNIDIPAGVTVKCEHLLIDGRECSGVWGAPDSGAPNTDERLIGSGFISCKSGMILIVF